MLSIVRLGDSEPVCGRNGRIRTVFSSDVSTLSHGIKCAVHPEPLPMVTNVPHDTACSSAARETVSHMRKDVS